ALPDAATSRHRRLVKCGRPYFPPVTPFATACAYAMCRPHAAALALFDRATRVARSRLDEGVPQCAQGVVVAGPDGARGHAERGGGLFGGDVAVVDLEQHPTLVGRQSVKRASEQAAVQHGLV